MTSTIETTSGLYLDYEKPRPEQIRVEDIARALSHIPRFGGHTSEFYSVAQHALLVYNLVITHFKVPSLALAALHHDSHEAYVGDVPTPLKRLLGVQYQVIAQRLDSVIASAVGCWFADLRHPIVKQADALAMRIEADALKVSRGLGEHWGFATLPEVTRWIDPAPPHVAERAFLANHRDAVELYR